MFQTKTTSNGALKSHFTCLFRIKKRLIIFGRYLEISAIVQLRGWSELNYQVKVCTARLMSSLSCTRSMDYRKHFSKHLQFFSSKILLLVSLNMESEMPLEPFPFLRYRISGNSFRRNYSFLKVENVEIFI